MYFPYIEKKNNSYKELYVFMLSFMKKIYFTFTEANKFLKILSKTERKLFLHRHKFQEKIAILWFE